ncbi:MAG: Fe-S oxidoreductase [Alphaproteobacteria bacterium]|nr:Fe-S oxidoreductase [Alphaproteobacteria bacterium]
MREELSRRMRRPQRHRLLHGYPMTPLLRRSSPDPLHLRRLDGGLTARSGEELEPPLVSLETDRPLIVGVMPHTQCQPKVEGCGFCTFPHDDFDKRGLRHTVGRVTDEVRRTPAELRRRRVVGVYLGGATANLMPTASLRGLLDALGATFDLHGAELTLEGVPSLFPSFLPGALHALRDGPGARQRVSMGVQTFDPAWLQRMGREHFGDRRVVEKVVSRAHGFGMTASADLLLGLPGRPLDEELADLRLAAGLGLDQICVYPLVLAGDTPWARDPAMVGALPGVEEGLARWLEVRELLGSLGFAQTTLTNFEREPAFVYERASFAPDLHDGLGIGPLSISTFLDPAARTAVKTVRGRSTREWMDVDRLWFPYEPRDVSLLLITRMLCALEIERARYAAVMGRDLADEHADAVAALLDEGLVTLDERALRLTPTGTYYADAVVGTFAAARAAEVRDLGAGKHTTDLARGRVVSDFMG